MFLHIGNNNIINTKDIIGIYDIESIKNTKEYKKMIIQLKEEHHLFVEKDIEEKTLILTREEKEIKGYISNISSITLAKRARNEKNIL